LAYLISDNSYQPRYTSSVPMLKLAPRQRQRYEFESFCLDQSRGSPRGGDAHTLLDARAMELRPYLGRIFDEYLSNPSRWKQYDVQQAVWYTEGRTQWAGLKPEQRHFIQTATHKEDPIHQHPVTLLQQMAEGFGTLVSANLILIVLLVLALITASEHPTQLVARALAWADLPSWAQGFSGSTLAQLLDQLAGHPNLITLRSSLDEKLQRLAMRLPGGGR
jgi:hypothetical protein